MIQGKFNFFSRFTSLPSVHPNILPVRLGLGCCTSTETLLPLLRFGELSSAIPEGNVRHPRLKASVVLRILDRKGHILADLWILNLRHLISVPFGKAEYVCNVFSDYLARKVYVVVLSVNYYSSRRILARLL